MILILTRLGIIYFTINIFFIIGVFIEIIKDDIKITKKNILNMLPNMFFMLFFGSIIIIYEIYNKQK